jgi:predicted site-specific integrase-resolvase
MQEGKSTCKGVKISDEEASKQNIPEPTEIEEVKIHGKKYYSYIRKTGYYRGIRIQPKSQKIRMAAYCRVSTDQEEQLSSYENQVNYYKNFFKQNPNYEFGGIYADEGISGTNTKKRDEFNRMIADCRAHKINRIITKSISRFARNTLDCLNYVREL